jgi:hypothetical protein
VALLTAAIVAFYPPTLQDLPLLLTEPLVVLLAALWTYLFCLAHDDRISASRQRWLIAASSVVLAYLAITKIFFGWVLLASALGSVLIVIATRATIYRRWLVASVLALALCGPYLAYTYSVTGRLFYWGTSGGLSLYWMATPFPGELGDWFSLSDMRDDTRLAPQHRVLFASIEHLDELHQDDVLRAAAVSNIAQHPGKFLMNWFDNIGRLLLNYPYSFTPFNFKSLGIAFLNVPLLGLGLWSLAPAARSRRALPPALVVVALVATVAFVGSSLLSAYVRQFVPLVPLLALVGAEMFWDLARPLLPWPRC